MSSFCSSLSSALESYNDAEKAGDDIKGIPNFWFQALSYHPATQELIQNEDVEALECLTNIRCEINEGNF